MIIKVQNLLDQQANYSFLSSPTTSGGTLFPVKNISQFYANWAFQVGKTGEEKAEVLLITSSAPTGTALFSTGTARFDHQTDTPIYAIKFDQVVFQRSTAGTAGTATTMTNGTVTITPDSLYTIFDDTTGATTYAYKAYFKNSVTGDISATSDWLTSTGYTFYSLSKLRERTKNKLFSASYISNDDVVDQWINEWYERMNNTLVDVNKDYNLGSVSVTLGTSGLGTITATDYKEVRRVYYTTNGIDYFTAQKTDVVGFSPNETFFESHPYYYMYGDNVIGIKPSQSGTASLLYYKLSTPLSNETDELPTPMKGYTKSFVDYALSQAYYMDGKKSEGDRFIAAASEGLERFKNEVTPRSKSGPTYINFDEPISGDDSSWFFK